MVDTTPYETAGLRVKPEWVGADGWLKTVYYVPLFEISSDEVFEGFGLGAEYVEQRQGSFYTLEMRVRYFRGVTLDDPLNVSLQLLDYDEKRCHYFQELRHETEGWLAATAEAMCMHVDMTLKRASPFPDDVLAKIDALYQVHKSLPRSDLIGGAVGIS